MTDRLRRPPSHCFFLKQWAFFHLQLIGQEKRSGLMVSTLNMELDFVREVRREPGAANDANLIAGKTQFRNGLCESDEIINAGLSHAQPPCIHPKPDENGLPKTGAIALHNRDFPEILLGNP
jgi:hypothetical protein